MQYRFKSKPDSRSIWGVLSYQHSDMSVVFRSWLLLHLSIITKFTHHYSQRSSTGSRGHTAVVKPILTQPVSQTASLHLVWGLSRKRWLQLSPLWAHLLILSLYMKLAELTLVLQRMTTEQDVMHLGWCVECMCEGVEQQKNGPAMLTIWVHGSPFFFRALHLPKSWASPISSTFCGWSTVRLTCTSTQNVFI